MVRDLLISLGPITLGGVMTTTAIRNVTRNQAEYLQKKTSAKTAEHKKFEQKS